MSFLAGVAEDLQVADVERREPQGQRFRRRVNDADNFLFSSSRHDGHKDSLNADPEKAKASHRGKCEAFWTARGGGGGRAVRADVWSAHVLKIGDYQADIK